MNETSSNPGQETQHIAVEVAYATPARQLILPLTVAVGTTAYEAVLRSGICEEFAEIDPDLDPMGIFAEKLDGKGLPRPRQYVLAAGDRVEIYRPLTVDPKQARLQRAGRKAGQARG